MPTKEENRRLKSMVYEIDYRAEGLSDWEQRLISNLIDTEVDAFTPKQAEKIEEIYERYLG